MSLVWVYEFLATLVEYIGVFYFIHNTGDGKKSVYLDIVFSIPISIYIIIANMFQLVSFNAILGYFIYLFFAICVRYKNHKVDKFSLAIIYLLLIVLCDYTTISLLGFLLGEDYFVNEVLRIDSPFRKYFLLLAKSFLVALAILLKYFLQTFITKDKYKFILTFGIGITLLVFVTYNYTSAYSMLGWSIFIIIGSMLLFSFYFYKQWENEKALRKLLEMRNSCCIEYYRNLCDQQAEQKKALHDIKYHYLNTFQLLEDRKYEDCSKYLQSMIETFEKKAYMSYTNNSHIDFMINLKKYEAEKQGIVFTIGADVIEQGAGIKQEDINIILGNLLDNAIEACNTIESGNRWIELKINKMKGILLFTIMNNYQKPPQESNGIFLTRKEYSQFHGLGLQIVKEYIEKYNGTLDLHFCDNIFKAEITMFL